MKNRKIMLSVIAAAAAAAVGLGSVYAASMNTVKSGEIVILDGPGTEENETEETETESETETVTKTKTESEIETVTETKTESEKTTTGDSENSSILDELLGGLTNRKDSQAEKSDGEAYWDGGYVEEGYVEDGYVMSAAETGNAYYAEPAMPSWNTEEYSTVDETGFRDVKLYPLSTFGMDVDTASYALLRRNTLDDTLSWMPKDAVRIEEMINYFNYDYEMPEGDETFTITAQIADCPWNDQTKLMLIGLQAKDIPQEDIKDQNLVFLVDTSGSMYDADKLPLAVDALKYLLSEMDENDSVSIVTYAGSSEVALDPTKCTDEGKQQIIKALDALTADGGTYGEAGIRTAYELAQESFIEGGNNRVLLLTDGDFNLGQTDDSELVDLVKEQAQGQIFLSILGFGTGNYNDALAEELADKGNGNYSYIDSDMEARRVMGAALKGTLNTVAKDAKVQVDFNPAYIKGYRLVGYENRLMNAEDFEDDKKDGGEVGAGQQVTVLYELVTTDSDIQLPTAHSRYTDDTDESISTENAAKADSAGSEELSDTDGSSVGLSVADTGSVELSVADTGSVEQSDKDSNEEPSDTDTVSVNSEKEKVTLALASENETETTANAQPDTPAEGEYLTVSIRYKDPEEETSQLKERAVTSADEISEMSDNMSWAAGVAQIGMLLRESEYMGDSDYDEVRSRLQPLTGNDDFREEFLYLITRLKGVTLEDDVYTAW